MGLESYRELCTVHHATLSNIKRNIITSCGIFITAVCSEASILYSRVQLAVKPLSVTVYALPTVDYRITYCCNSRGIVL